MFIIDTIEKEEATGEVKKIYELMEENLGFLPPHTNLFATLDIKGLKEFYELNIYLKNHKRIDFKILPFLRLYIAQTECRNYCVKFNTKLLLASGVSREILKNITTRFDEIPLPDKQKLLLKSVLKAIYEPENFTKIDLDILDKNGFGGKDFYDVVNYATQFMVKSKIIEMYLKK